MKVPTLKGHGLARLAWIYFFVSSARLVDWVLGAVFHRRKGRDRVFMLMNGRLEWVYLVCLDTKCVGAGGLIADGA